MKELKELTEKERILISLQCEPLFLVSKPNRVFNHVFDLLSEGLEVKYDKEVWLVITAVVKALKYHNKGTRFSLRKQDYTTANKVHKQKLSATRAREVLLLLEEQGFLEVYKGFYFNDKKSMSTCVLFKDRLLEIIDPLLAEKYGTKRDKTEYIEIKSADGNKSQLDLKGFRGCGLLMNFMERYNNFLAKHDIKVWDEDLQRYVKCITVYKRVFYGDLKGAGRFYSLGKFQTLKSHLRKTFLLDNEVSTEMDYSCLQPRFLYTMNGIRLVEGWDAYDIPDLRHLCTSTDQEFRSFMKEVYLCILFSTDKKLAIKGIQSKANKRKDINVPNNKVCDMIVETVLVHNEEVRHEFFKDCLWAKLQNMDSRLTEYIIKRFTDLGKVCLGWHDSYVVCKSDRELLKSTMEDSWRSLFGLDMNCKIKLEF